MWGLLQNGLCELYSEHHCGKLKMVVKRAHITCFSKAKTKGKQSEDGEKKIQLRKDKAQQVQIIWVQHGIPGTLWCPAMGRTITQSVSVALCEAENEWLQSLLAGHEAVNVFCTKQKHGACRVGSGVSQLLWRCHLLEQLIQALLKRGNEPSGAW